MPRLVPVAGESSGLHMVLRTENFILFALCGPSSEKRKKKMLDLKWGLLRGEDLFSESLMHRTMRISQRVYQGRPRVRLLRVGAISEMLHAAESAPPGSSTLEVLHISGASASTSVC